MTTNPNEPATDAVNRTAQEILAALQTKDSAKVTSYYAPDAVLATPGRPAARGGEAVSKAIRNDIADPNFKISDAATRRTCRATQTRRPRSPARVTWPTAAARSKSLIRTRRPNRRRMPRAPT